MTQEKDSLGLETRGHYAVSLDGRPDEVYDAPFEDLVRQMLVRVGEDPKREGLRRTPLRVAKALDFLTSGYRMTVDDVVRDAVFTEDAKEMSGTSSSTRYASITCCPFSAALTWVICRTAK